MLPTGEYLECQVFCYEYAGFADVAPGICCPTEQTVFADADAAYTCLKEQYGVKESEIVVFGRSIGGGPAVELTSRHPKEIAGLILESPFLSVFRVVNESIATQCLCCCDVFKNIDKAPKLECPVMLIHGTDDQSSFTTFFRTNMSPSGLTEQAITT